MSSQCALICLRRIGLSMLASGLALGNVWSKEGGGEGVGAGPSVEHSGEGGKVHEEKSVVRRLEW